MDNDITSKLWPEFKGPDILKKGTLNTPFIALKDKNLYIRGISKPINAIKFYDPLMGKVETLALDGKINAVNIMLVYFVISSSYHIKRLLETVLDGGREYDSKNLPRINWYYEENDESMREAGEDYAGMVPLKFKFMKIKS